MDSFMGMAKVCGIVVQKKKKKDSLDSNDFKNHFQFLKIPLKSILSMNRNGVKIYH